MSKIPTAKLILTGKETYEPEYSTVSKYDALEAMIEFAKLHVEAALKEASENCKFKIQSHFNNNEEINNSIEDCIGNLNVIDKNSILNAYPLNLIK